jgi:hypothetical protein
MYTIFEFIKKHQLKIILSSSILFLLLGQLLFSTIIFIIYLSMMDNQ